MTKETINTPIATKLFYTIIPTAATALAVATVVPSSSFSIPLLIILILTALFISVSAWMTHRDIIKIQITVTEQDEEDPSSNSTTKAITSIQFYNIIQSLMKPSLPIICLFYASSFTFIITLMIRLFSVNKFGGDATKLDYGPKVGTNSETNAAFMGSGADVGHFIQGFVAALLSYPAVVGFLSKIVSKATMRRREQKESSSESSSSILFVKPCVLSLSILQLLQSCMTYYPLYSMIKRLLKYQSSSFSQTSHLNNTTEWCLGVVLGVAVGSLLSSFVQRQIILKSDSNESRIQVMNALMTGEDINGAINEKEFMFGKTSEWKDIAKYPQMLKLVNIISIANLCLFTITTFLTGLFIGLSWNYDEDDSKVNGVIVAVYATIFVVVHSFFVAFEIPIMKNPTNS